MPVFITLMPKNILNTLKKLDFLTRLMNKQLGLKYTNNDIKNKSIKDGL